MKKFLLYFIFLLVATYSCSDTEVEQGVSKSKIFDKVDKRDRKLFTEEERINSYNKSLKKSESIKASLAANSGYSGYGSSKVLEKKETNKKTKRNKVAKPKFSNAGYSAYSTN